MSVGINYELKQLVGQQVTLIYEVADSGCVISRTILKGILKGRTCKKNYNDFDLYGVVSFNKTSMAYIDVRQWAGNQSYMATLDHKTIKVTFNPR